MKRPSRTASPQETNPYPPQSRQIEGREWWLWAFAVTVTLALTAGILVLVVGEKSDLLEWVRGLAALVLLFDIYTVYQHLQLQRVRRQLAEQDRLRDQLLRLQSERLEQEVAARTDDLLIANAELRRAEEKYRTIFENAVIGIFQITPEGRPLNVNRALAQMHGHNSSEDFLAEVSNLPAQLLVDPDRMRDFERILGEEGTVRGAEAEVYRRDRSRKWTLWNMRAVRDAEGRVVLYEGMVEDVTDRKLAEKQVQFLAYYDPLTGLPNRTLLQDRLAKSLAGARRRNEKVAVLFVDLDRFKTINDSLGHTFGDQLLQGVAQRLKKVTREQDTVARIGGDEFVIALSAVNDVQAAAVAAERFMDAMVAEFELQGRSFAVNCSIGISLFPDHGQDSETLIERRRGHVLSQGRWT